MADLASRITQPPAEGDATGAAPAADAQEATPAGGPGLWDSEQNVQVTLSDLQADQNTPFYSATTFKDLNLSPEILQGLLALGYRAPSKIQGTGIPLMLKDPPHHLLAQSQSGTGKTAAFVIGMLSRIDLTQPDVPQALALAPSRELTRQIETVVKQIGRFCEGLQVAAAVPGALPRGEAVKANIVVGTPGTVLDTIRRRQLDVSQLRILVIDEADNMLDQQGLGDQCMRIKQLLPRTIQTLLFSATFPDKVMRYADKFAPKALKMTLAAGEQTVKGISQMYMDCPGEQDKYDILCKLYGLMTVGSSVIFVKTRESASEIKRRMEADGHRVTALHGAFEGAERDALLEDFRSGKTKVLITTNVLARGIDVSTVSMVINYDIPMKGKGDSEPDPETYLHRIGRTGRFGRIGVSISFVYDKKSFQALSDIANQYGIDLVQLKPDDWDEAEKRVQAVIKSNRAQAAFVPSATDPRQPAEA
ncbi:ATP-dependent RNA helicase DBP5 [Scedosporium apiospermum]|uniref:RNA helicase n=1 Tax=Pseudallescheria apiosperma TaxID=563466 RepID=A0A084G050_PSEDA|nr:ATP-dependent RNA helicase DBP5 [Scedosporium apiospermum]KEZ40712.1 ATP-dependent RNA helicase DBP5 [Scedosporium apiospermum]